MIKPPELNTERGEQIWAVITSAASGDTATLRRLVDEDPSLSREGYFYTPPIHFAVREGHRAVVEILLAAGADAEWNGYYGESLIGMARERGYDDIAALLEQAGHDRGRAAPAENRVDHPIHGAAESGDVRGVRDLLDADPTLHDRADNAGGTPLHRAVIGRARRVVELLLDRGADIHAIHGTAKGAPHGYWPYDIQAIDLAIWGGRRRTIRPPLWRIVVACIRYWIRRRRGPVHAGPCDPGMARLLVKRGCAYDVAIATALGDLDGVKAILDKDPLEIRKARPNGRRALSTAVEFGHDEIARLLLERGADPTWPESNGPRGTALFEASRIGNLPMVKLLLAHGADPNAHSESAGNALFVAKTPEIRALLAAHGGTLDPYDLVWLDLDDEVMRRVTEDPQSAELGCGGVFTAVVTRGKRDLLKRLLDAGIRVPSLVTGCQSYLMEQLDMFQALLESGMNPDTSNWQRQTMLHQLCGSGKEDPGAVERAKLLLDAGANISARDDDLWSTPLGWAARNNRPEMVEFLLSRGAPTNLPDDKPWSTPLAWATRRGHTRIVEMLRAAGAKS
jgi:ankyrin repeat protein